VCAAGRSGRFKNLCCSAKFRDAPEKYG